MEERDTGLKGFLERSIQITQKHGCSEDRIIFMDYLVAQTACSANHLADQQARIENPISQPHHEAEDLKITISSGIFAIQEQISKILRGQ